MNVAQWGMWLTRCNRSIQLFELMLSYNTTASTTDGVSVSLYSLFDLIRRREPRNSRTRLYDPNTPIPGLFPHPAIRRSELPRLAPSSLLSKKRW